MDNNPEINVLLWVHDYAIDLCQKIFSSYSNVTVKGIGKNRAEYQDKLLARSPYAHYINNLAFHITDHAFVTIVGRTVEDKYKNYIQLDPIDVSHFNLPERYVIVTTGFTSATRVWNSDSINQTVEYIKSKGYEPVFIGKSFTEAYNGTGIIGKFNGDYTRGTNLIDKTTLFEAHGIIAKAKAVVGLDNGLLHLSAMTQVPIVYGFTSVEPMHRLPYRNDIMGWNCFVVKPDVSCFGCQSNVNFPPKGHDFRFCLYQTYACVNKLDSNLFIEQLEKIL